MRSRRDVLAAALAAVPLPLLAQTAPLRSPMGQAQAQSSPRPVAAGRLAQRLRIVIPANPGGGWDQTGRALGEALLAAGVAEDVVFENRGGKGGLLGLAHYVEAYDADPDSLLIGGMVMVGAVALHKPAIDLARVRPLARLTSDYLVLAVPADSPIRSVAELRTRVTQDLRALPMAGGSAGGVDHMFAGLFARQAGGHPEDLNYLPFASGPEVVAALLAGKAVAGVSGLSEFSEPIRSGKLRALGVSARRSVGGLMPIREQGVDVEMANWRGVFTGQGVSPERSARLLEGLQRAVAHDSWQKALRSNRWESSWLAGPALGSFIDLDATTARVMVHMLKLKP